ncbi:hypothetical protein M409DRAFT_20211 [Zasmidium cellare ATCC 36951]|uniref:Autophagy-related protein 17 n=1 Tax=Zasmidium cellare ATCC 36951 TaxID=1080233 RepID=A0A6A6CWB3_ZASCE|nr:uncharacterized protein M409DRAFT_20211 [Zasmidium cellare ATCC 36951]KAF2169796.1 hypothetical protein M409DRAFT_20211 [Zasmidium cellare ATCC 36951]
MRRQHDELTEELEAAQTAYEEADEQRDQNRDPYLEDGLNLQYLYANNRLACASREYNVYMDEFDNMEHQHLIADMPPAETAPDTDRTSIATSSPDDRTTLLSYTTNISALERKRQDLVTSDTIARLSEHIAYLEHLHTSLLARVSQHQTTIATLTSDLDDAQTLLDNFNAQIEDGCVLARGLADENSALRQHVAGLTEAVQTAEGEVGRLEGVVREMGLVEGVLRVDCEVLRGEVRVARGRVRELELGGNSVKVEESSEEGGGVRLEDSTEAMDERLVLGLWSG